MGRDKKNFNYLRPIRRRWQQLDIVILFRLSGRLGLAWLRRSGGEYGLERVCFRDENDPSIADEFRHWASSCRKIALYSVGAYYQWTAGWPQTILECAGYGIEFAAADNACVYAEYQHKLDPKKYGKVVYCDLTNLVPAPALIAIGKLTGWTGQKAGHEASEAEVAAWTAHLAGLLSCCCQYLGIEGLAPTAGQTAFGIFRRTHCLERDVAQVLDRDMLTHLSASVAGAEVIASVTGKIEGPWYYVDVHQAYHWAAHTYPVCGVPVWWRYFPGKSTTLTAVRDAPCIATVALDASDYRYPVRKSAYECEYTTRPVTTTLAGEELAYAVERGHVIEPLWLSVWKPSEGIAKYGEWACAVLASAKRTLPAYQYAVIKRWLTALYGKFAQFPWRRERRDDVVPHVWNGSWEAPGRDGPCTRYDCVDGVVFEVYYDPTTGPRMFHVWTSVTAACRVTMHRVRQIVGRGNWVYSDADCIVINDVGLSRLHAARLIGDKPGQWRVKMSAKEIEIIAPRHYRIGDHSVAAGVHVRTELPGSPDWWFVPEAYQHLYSPGTRKAPGTPA